MKGFSQFFQDVVVYELLSGLGVLQGGPGTYVDLATNDAIQFSNTYLFDTLKWRGTCIEPNPAYHSLIERARTCELHKVCVSNEEGYKEFVMSGPTGHIKGRRLESVLCRRLDSLALPSHVNYLSLDIEGEELNAMRTWDWNRTIDVITVENPQPPLIHFFKSRGMINLACISLDGVFVRQPLYSRAHALLWPGEKSAPAALHRGKHCVHRVPGTCAQGSSCCFSSWIKCNANNHTS